MAAKTAAEDAPPATSVARCRWPARIVSCSRRSRSSRSRGPASTKDTTARGPAGVSIGTEVYETGSLVPSRRTNHSRSAAPAWAVAGGQASHGALRRVVAERRERCRVRESDPSIGVHHADRVRGVLQNRGEEQLGDDVEAHSDLSVQARPTWVDWGTGQSALCRGPEAAGLSEMRT